MAVACTSRIEVALARLAQCPHRARQSLRQSRGRLESRWAHVFELRLRPLHDDGGGMYPSDVGYLKLLQEYDD